MWAFKITKPPFRTKKFLDAFWYTIKFTVIAVITINVTALALALMVTKISRLSGIFRTIFFLPNMLGGLALGFIWQFIFQIVFSQILFGPEFPLANSTFCRI